MATMNDVADLAGVSTTTVSHVMNGTRPVAGQTRARVLDAIERSGYAPDVVARSLVRSRTDSIGLVVPDTSLPDFAGMVRGVEFECRSRGFTLLLANSAEDGERQLASIRALRERRVDGLLVAQVTGGDAASLDYLRRHHLPVVLIDRLLDPTIDQVGVANVKPMRTLVGHLIRRGHRSIAVVAGDDRLLTLAERLQGFREAHATAGVAVDERLVLRGAETTEAAREATIELLRSDHRPTAIVASSLRMATGALGAIAELEIAIPGDLAFASFDEFPYADLFSPRLTSVEQPSFEIGREAMRLLARRIADNHASPETVRLEPRIVHRESCGCPPGTPFESEG
jgi:LacI family transcriptional regulator